MPEKKSKRKIARNVVVGLLVVGALAYGGKYGWYWWTEGRFVESTDNAYVRADVTLLAPRVAGYVENVEVVDNQVVTRGQVLFRIDNRDFQARVDLARADVSARRAAIEAARSQLQLQNAVISQTEADAEAAAAEVERAKRDLERAEALVRTNAVSIQSADLARSNATKAVAAARAAQARITSEKDRVSVLDAQEKGAEAALAQAEASLKLAEICPSSGFLGQPAA